MISYFIYRVINKLAKIFRISIIYRTKFGIKPINQLNTVALSHGEEFFVNVEDLFLGFDAIKDKYTLAGVNISNSPHKGLMQALDNGKNIIETDYCQRYIKGRLDSRRGVYLSRKRIHEMENIFKLRKEQLSSGTYVPVQVYKLGGKYYIADGKHRAALCAHLNIPVKCVEISSDFLKDSFRVWIYNYMKKNKAEYLKNISLFAEVFNE